MQMLFRQSKAMHDFRQSATGEITNILQEVGIQELILIRQENITIIGRVGSFCGSTYLSLKKCWVTDNAIIVKSKSNCSNYTHVTLLNQNLNKFRTRSGQPLLNQSIFAAISTNIPIKSIIDKFESLAMPYFGKIELNLEHIKIINNIRDILLPKLMSGVIVQ